MSNSKNVKLYPLFRQTSKASTAQHIDDDDSSGDEDDVEDDVPLTALLTHRMQKSPSTMKGRLQPPKKERGTKRPASKIKENIVNTENKDPHSTEYKKRKQEGVKSSLSIKNEKTTNIDPKVKNTVAQEVDLHETNYDREKCHDAQENENGCDDTGSSKQKHSTNVTRFDVSQRHYSDTAMDYVAPNQSQQESGQSQVRNISNIVHKLNRRIINGGCLPRNPLNQQYSPFGNSRIVPNKISSLTSSYCWPKKWRIPSWISLTQQSMGSHISGGKNIDHFAWDPMGVLLAVAIDRTITIFDWDMFRAANMRGRSDRARKNLESEFKIPPVVTFRLQQPVASLVWNPFEIDELAVGFRVSGETIIYNVDRVARWLSKDPSRNNQRLPPPSTCKKIMLQRVTGSVNEVMFLDKENVAISVGRILFCWKLSMQSKNVGRQQRGPLIQGSLVWRYQPPSHVTSMASLGSNLVVIGTNQGHMCLVDWTKRTKVSLSFSHEHRPKVLQTWIPHDRLRAPKEDKSLRKMMGIAKLKVETSNQECIVGEQHWGRCRVKWVTQSGWLLSTILDSTRRHHDCVIHYSSPEVLFKNNDGTPINTSQKSWSLPYNGVGIDLSSNQVLACFVGVPTVTKILSHHDKFVLDSQPDTIVSKEISFIVHDMDNDTHKIPFPGVVKELPQALAVHPSLEWIVIGVRNKLLVLC